MCMEDITFRLKQYQEEFSAWRRILAFIQQETATLKMRLSDMLSNSGLNNSVVGQAEEYQARILRKEEMVGLMRRDICELEKQLNKAITSNQLDQELILKQKDLRREFRHVISAFNELKFSFNNFVAENY